jgi:hypothetical protein
MQVKTTIFTQVRVACIWENLTYTQNAVLQLDHRFCDFQLRIAPNDENITGQARDHDKKRVNFKFSNMHIFYIHSDETHNWGAQYGEGTGKLKVGQSHDFVLAGWLVNLRRS